MESGLIQHSSLFKVLLPILSIPKPFGGVGFLTKFKDQFGILTAVHVIDQSEKLLFLEPDLQKKLLGSMLNDVEVQFYNQKSADCELLPSTEALRDFIDRGKPCLVYKLSSNQIVSNSQKNWLDFIFIPIVSSSLYEYPKGFFESFLPLTTQIDSDYAIIIQYSPNINKGKISGFDIGNLTKHSNNYENCPMYFDASSYKLLNYSISTEPGASGSPIIQFRNKNEYGVIGLHIGTSNNQDKPVNIGIPSDFILESLQNPHEIKVEFFTPNQIPHSSLVQPDKVVNWVEDQTISKQIWSTNDAKICSRSVCFLRYFYEMKYYDLGCGLLIKTEQNTLALVGLTSNVYSNSPLPIKYISIAFWSNEGYLGKFIKIEQFTNEKTFMNYCGLAVIRFVSNEIKAQNVQNIIEDTTRKEFEKNWELFNSRAIRYAKANPKSSALFITARDLPDNYFLDLGTICLSFCDFNNKYNWNQIDTNLVGTRIVRWNRKVINDCKFGGGVFQLANDKTISVVGLIQNNESVSDLALVDLALEQPLISMQNKLLR